MNIFQKEIMRRVKECDCDAVYRERGNSVSVMYDGKKIAEIRSGKCEKSSDLTVEESEKFFRVRRLFGNISNYCSAYEKISASVPSCLGLYAEFTDDALTIA